MSQAVGSSTSQPSVTAHVPPQLSHLISSIAKPGDVKSRLASLIGLGATLEVYPESHKTTANRVLGCTTQVWVSAALDASGHVTFSGTADSDVSRGLVALLTQGLSGLAPAEVMAVQPEVLATLGLNTTMLGPSRSNGAANMLEAMKRRAGALIKEFPLFPSIVITANSLQPQGTFAEVQAQYLSPDQEQVQQLADVLQSKKIGVVAHFYMDPEVQGVLTSAAEQWPHIAISDSLVMADTAVRMAEAGCK